MSLAIPQGENVTIVATGDHAEEAINESFEKHYLS